MENEIKTIPLPTSVQKVADVFCGCGDPEQAWETIKAYLENYSLVDDDWDKRTLDLDTGEKYIVAYLLDHLELTEHGTSIRGAWLTDDGHEVLAFLNEHGTDWAEKKGIEYLSADGVSYGDFM